MIYYNWNKAFSFNALFHLIISERGFGKTYGLIISQIKQFYYNKKKSIFLTKFQNELEGKTSYQYSTYQTIVDDINVNIKEIKQLKIQFKLVDNHIYINDEIAFSFYAINSAEKIKKYTELKTYSFLIHDECITFNSYCKNEIDKLFTIYDTMNRRKELKDSVKLILLGNALTRYNIYFDYFNFNKLKHGYHFIKSSRWLIHISDDKPYQTERKKTAITLLSGMNSEYAKMSNQSMFVYDETDFIADNVTEFEKNYFMIQLQDKVATLSKFQNGYILHTKNKATKLYHFKTPKPYSAPLGKERVSKLRLMYNNSDLYFESIDIKSKFEKEFI